MKRNGLLFGAFAALVVLSIYGGLLAQSGGPAAGTRVTGVNVVRIFNEYERQKDLGEEMREVEQRLNLERDERKRQIDAQQATLDAMNPNDPAYMAKMRELLKMQIEFKNWFDLQQADMTREIAVWSARIYGEILDAVEQIAAQDGYDIVLYLDEFQFVMGEPEVIREQIRNRKVLYCSPTSEITDIVLKKLNDDYRARPKEKMLQIP